MSMHPALVELLNWSLDHPGQTPPPHLMKPIESSPHLFEEWKRLQGWSSILKDDAPWQAPEGFFEQLADKAMTEKRRSALTESTRRELSLDLTDWAAWLWPASSRIVMAWSLALVVCLPVAWMGLRMHQSIGHVHFAKGHATLAGNDNRVVEADETLWRGSVLQTTTQAQGIVHLEGGVEVCMDARSRIVFTDSRTLSVQRGRAYFDVPPGQQGFRVTMPHGEAFVLGTSFAIDVTAERSRVSVTRGTVRVSDRDSSIDVRQGSEAIAGAQNRLLANPITQPEQRIQWVAALLEDSMRDEMQMYFPSLTGPTPAAPERQP